MAFSKPQSIFVPLGDMRAMKVADFGCGAGHVAVAAASRVGSDGVVYAVDINRELIKRLHDEIVDEIGHPTNSILPLWGDIERNLGVMIKNEVLDRVFMVNVLFSLSGIREAMLEAFRVLKPGGLLLVAESFSQIDSHRNLGLAKLFAGEAGFVHENNVTIEGRESGFIVFKPE